MSKETRKEEILRVAAQLFKEKGYSAVTMRDLAKAMGIKAASLYNHIDSKQAILQDIILEIAEDFTSGMKNIQNSDKSSFEKLKDIVTLHVEIAANNANGLSALNSDWMHLEGKLEYYLNLRQNYEANFKRIVEIGITKEEIRPVDPEILMFSMLSTLRSLYLWIPKKTNKDLDLLTQDLSTILLEGINK